MAHARVASELKFVSWLQNNCWKSVFDRQGTVWTLLPNSEKRKQVTNSIFSEIEFLFHKALSIQLTVHWYSVAGICTLSDYSSNNLHTHPSFDEIVFVNQFFDKMCNATCSLLPCGWVLPTSPWGGVPEGCLGWSGRRWTGGLTGTDLRSQRGGHPWQLPPGCPSHQTPRPRREMSDSTDRITNKGHRTLYDFAPISGRTTLRPEVWRHHPCKFSVVQLSLKASRRDLTCQIFTTGRRPVSNCQPIMIQQFTETCNVRMRQSHPS